MFILAFHIKKMILADACEIVAWKYDEPYSFYNIQDRDEGLKELLNGSYYSVFDNNNQLIGFFCFGTSAQVPAGQTLGLYKNKKILDIGLGMKQSRTGKGTGQSFVEAGLAFANEAFHPKEMRLTVAVFNKRAITVYKRVGFSMKHSFKHHGVDFITMTCSYLGKN